MDILTVAGWPGIVLYGIGFLVVGRISAAAYAHPFKDDMLFGPVVGWILGIIVGIVAGAVWPLVLIGYALSKIAR